MPEMHFTVRWPDGAEIRVRMGIHSSEAANTNVGYVGIGVHPADRGVHRASSIKAAEAAKVIENTQRDLNIALMNELAIIFDKIGIDTTEVLAAAGTKWNFLKFQPGLVGEQAPGLSVRFTGINRSGIASYLVTQYSSLAVLTDDALAVLEGASVDQYHEYK